MANTNARILSTGRAYPEGVLMNADLEKLVEASDDYSNIAMHGNTSSASIPITHDECVERDA